LDAGWALLLMLFAAGCSSSSTPLAISIAITPQSCALSSGQSQRFSTTITNQISGTTSQATSDNSKEVKWSTTVGSIDSNGNYMAPSGGESITATVKVESIKDSSKFATAVIHVVAPGQVSKTANPQVAVYSIQPLAAGNVFVQFGPDTNYALTTWTQAVPQEGAPLTFYVAGMKANTPYHMRAVVQFSDGTQLVDSDHVFTTGAIDLTGVGTITATTSPGMTPQSGVELLAPILGTARPMVTDLNGNILWMYSNIPNADVPNPIKLLPNGHFLINFSRGVPDGGSSVLEEVDLAGNVIWQMAGADLNEALATASCAGCNITVVGTHHDFAMLPNGHIIVIAATQRTISGTVVTGDVLIDLDQNHQPVWLWNEFDHLDVDRQPMQFPDWTHTNAVLYSPGDGNLIVSMRHQNWIVKVDYANGAGAGGVIWKLGYQGDFTLVGGTDPIDWFYAQHGPSFVSANTSGRFSLVVFDNGNDRVFPAGVTCGTTGAPACLYSTVAVMDIDETAMTATLVLHATAPTYSFFGGNTEQLKNGNLEYCESAGGGDYSGQIDEVTQGSDPQTVWQMLISENYAYRGQRIPSLYPGVQW
jgi:hypothetical protein